MQLAQVGDESAIFDLYDRVIQHVNATDIKLGWNTATYPDMEFINTAIANGQMCIVKDADEIVAAAVVNHHVNPEYDDIDWEVKAPKDRIATIHALATSPKKRGTGLSMSFLAELDAYCKAQGDVAIHLDVIDTNIPAYKLYTRSGYSEVACIKMYYEVVGTREFWMMEKVL